MYKISEIATITNGEIISKNSDIANCCVEDILLDSRKFLKEKNTIFFALKTNRNNGHLFIEKLYNKNVKYFVISEYYDEFEKLTDAVFILVKNTLDALHKITAWHRTNFNLPVIGITGSNGKTIVKEWLYQLLYKDKVIVRSPKSYNSQIGVPLSVWKIKIENELAIFEAGISEPNEMENLQKIINPTIGIFTNIGTAHSESFINVSQKAAEKLKLFTSVDYLIYCSDYNEITERILNSNLHQKIHLITWGTRNDPNYLILEINKIEKNSILKIQNNLQNVIETISIPFTDDASIENAIHCWCLMKLLGYNNKIINNRFKDLHPVGMRLEMKDGINSCSIIDDSYNSDLNSLQIALDFMYNQHHLSKRTIILSDILQTGKKDKELYQEIAQLLKLKNVSKIIGIGKAIKAQTDCFDIEKYFFETTDEYLKNFHLLNFHKEIILLKGARIFQFEKISYQLQLKIHETILEVNLSTLIENINYYKSLLKPNVKLMAMVKAFSYGSGSYEIANALQFNNVDYLAVAYIDEGVELRRGGIKMPIMVINPDINGFDTLIKYNLEPEISSIRMLNQLENILYNSELSETIGIHLKFDTGMHRLGFDNTEVEKIIEKLKKFDNHITIKSIFSHLASSENSADDEFTLNQIKKIQNIFNEIQQQYNYKIDLHILNSAGITRFADAQFDMVRLGIGMYGVSVNKNEEGKLKNVCSLITTISQIKTIPKGDTVSYNLLWRAERETKIGIIPIGYADGLRRDYGNGKGKVLINGKFATILGAICMDMCIVNLNDIDAVEGDKVVVFGDEYPINNVAKILNTISYEILTSISRRVKRIYFQE